MEGIAQRRACTFILGCTINFRVSIQEIRRKELGIFIDNKLKWEYHIQDICKKLHNPVGYSVNFVTLFVERLLLALYHSLISHHLLCGITNLGSADSGVFRIYKRGGPTFNKLKSCNEAKSQTEFSVGVRMIF